MNTSPLADDAQPTRSRRREALGWTAAMLILLVPLLARAVESAMHFAGSAIDGPFQLYNGLRRIEAGYQPGVDFQYFHGIGVPYLHYWLFRLLGGQFHDAEMARQLIAVGAFALSALLFYRAFARSWRRALCLSAATIALVVLAGMPTLLFAVNSMIGVRSALPTLLAAVLYAARSRPSRAVAGGVTLGIALFVSTEQGLAVLLAYLIVSAITIVRQIQRKPALFEVAALLLTAAITLVIALIIVGGPTGALGALRYNFVLVPTDQYWFFGAPPNPFIASWSTLPSMLAGAPRVGLAILFGIGAAAYFSARLWRAARRGDAERVYPLALLAVYGVVSCASLLGVFVPVYTVACWRVLFALGLLEVLGWAERRDGAVRIATGAVPRSFAIGVAVLVALAVVGNRGIRGGWMRSIPHAIVSHVLLHDRFTISPMWSRTLAIDSAVIQRFADSTHRDPTVWSTYAGWLEARAGVFHPSFDYVIHALGPQNRHRYLERFRTSHPDLVQTIAPTYTVYEPWIENANWDLYHDLLAGYEIRARTPWSLLWEPRAASDTGLVIQTLAEGVVDSSSNAIRLPEVPAVGGERTTLLEIEIEYSTRNALRWLPVVGDSPRYLLGVEGAITRMPVSLPPYFDRLRFAILAAPGQHPVLRLGTFSLLPGASFRITRLRVSAVAVPPANRAWLTSLAELESP